MSLTNLLVRFGLKNQDVTVDERVENRLQSLGRRVPARLPQSGRSAFKYQY